MKISRLLLCGLTAMLIGCTTRIVDFTIISTKNIDFGSLARAKRGNKRVSGEDMVHIIIIIPTGTPNLKTAIDRAIESVPGAVAMVDGVVYSHAFYIPYIYGQSSYIIEGTPLIISSTANHAPAKWMVSQYDSEQKRVVSRPVTKEQFEALKLKIALGNPHGAPVS